MKLRDFYVYILTNTHNQVLYVGMTNDLVKRTSQHQSGAGSHFTKQYNLHKLIYYEICDTAEQAIAREKQLKSWRRQWKLDLIKGMNPDLRDLSQDFE